jgi:hypothetical protein
MDDAYDDVQSKENIRNIFYIAAGTIWAINMADVLFLPPQWKRNVTIGAGSSGKNQLCVNLSWKW